MKDSTKRLLLIGGSVIVIAGVAYYFYSQNKSNELTDEDASEPTSNESEPSATPSTEPANIPSPVNLPIELNSMDKAKKFQDFMDSIGPWIKGVDGKYKKLNKGTGYGIVGPSTRSAFTIYGDLYRVYLIAGSKGKVIPLAPSVQPSIDINLSTGRIARYQNDKKFVEFEKNFGSVRQTGSWSNNGRKIVLNFGPKKGQTISTNSFWDTLKQLAQ